MNEPRASMPRRIATVFTLIGVFFYELAVSSVSVARAAFARTPQTQSAIIAMPIHLKTDLGIAVLANLVTLTPGTCSLHISEDRRTLYIHALDAPSPDDVIAGIRQAFERRIRRIEG